MPLKPRSNRMPFLTPSPRYLQEKRAKQAARRDKTVLSLYSTPEWRALRAVVLREAGYRCCVSGCPLRAAVADHRIPHRGDNGLFFSRDNLQAMCKHHHDQKTARHDGGFGNRKREPIPTSEKRRVRPPDGPYPPAPGAGGEGKILQPSPYAARRLL